MIHPKHVTTPPSKVDKSLKPSTVAHSSGAWLRATRDGLGVSAAELATVLGVGLRSVQRWEASEVPGWAVTEIDAIVNLTIEWLDEMEHTPDPIAIFHDGWHVVRFGKLLPASWWRATVGTASIMNPGLTITWGD